MTDHDVLNGNQGQKQNEADNVVAAHHELSKGLNHASRGRGAFRAMQKNSPAAGEIEGQAEQSHQQKQAGEN